MDVHVTHKNADISNIQMTLARNVQRVLI